jgi:hypothetical protein
MTDRTATIGDNRIASLVQSARDEWSAYDAAEADVLKFRAKAAEYTEKANAADNKADDAIEKGASHAIKIGELLIELKEHVKHGEWESFVAEQFPGRKLRTCQSYMKLAGAPDPEAAERAAQAADAERKRQEREAERMAEAEAVRVREAEENEKRRTAAASGAFALTTIENAQPAPVASQWASVLPATAAPEPHRRLTADDREVIRAANGGTPAERMPAPPLAEQGAAVLTAFEGWVDTIRARGEAIDALPMADRVAAVKKLMRALSPPPLPEQRPHVWQCVLLDFYLEANHAPHAERVENILEEMEHKHVTIADLAAQSLPADALLPKAERIEKAQAYMKALRLTVDELYVLPDWAEKYPDWKPALGVAAAAAGWTSTERTYVCDALEFIEGVYFDPAEIDVPDEVTNWLQMMESAAHQTP